MSTRTLDNDPAQPQTVTGRRSWMQNSKRALRNPATRPGTSVEALYNDELTMQHQTRPPDKLPDPWLFNTEQLLRELDRCRELTLQIPITNPNATHFGINVAVTAQWNLREHVRHVALMHAEAQSRWAKLHDELQRSLHENPIAGAKGMERKRRLREIKQQITNLKERLASLENQFAQESIPPGRAPLAILNREGT